MHVLNLTRQKFDVWIGAAFLPDNATRLVERAGEIRQADSDVEFMSNFISLIEFDAQKMRPMNRA